MSILGIDRFLESSWNENITKLFYKITILYRLLNHCDNIQPMGL